MRMGRAGIEGADSSALERAGSAGGARCPAGRQARRTMASQGSLDEKGSARIAGTRQWLQ